MSPRLECVEVLESLESYLDGELEAGREAFERHLAHCSDCREELGLASRIRSELRSWPELDTPPHVLREVFSVVGKERFTARPTPQPARHRPAWAALAAAVLAVVALGSGIYWQSRTSLPASSEPVIASLPGLEDLDPEEVARATEEAQLALAYFARVSRRTAFKVRDEVLIDRLVKPSSETLTRALRPLEALSKREVPEGDRS